MLPSDAAGVELRYTTDGSSVTSSSDLFPTLDLTLNANTTLRVRAFHSLYFASNEVSAFYFVEIPARSAAVRARAPLRCHPHQA